MNEKYLQRLTEALLEPFTVVVDNEGIVDEIKNVGPRLKAKTKDNGKTIYIEMYGRTFMGMDFGTEYAFHIYNMASIDIFKDVLSDSHVPYEIRQEENQYNNYAQIMVPKIFLDVVNDSLDEIKQVGGKIDATINLYKNSRIKHIYFIIHGSEYRYVNQFYDEDDDVHILTGNQGRAEALKNYCDQKHIPYEYDGHRNLIIRKEFFNISSRETLEEIKNIGHKIPATWNNKEHTSLTLGEIEFNGSLLDYQGNLKTEVIFYLYDPENHSELKYYFEKHHVSFTEEKDEDDGTISLIIVSLIYFDIKDTWYNNIITDDGLDEIKQAGGKIAAYWSNSSHESIKINIIPGPHFEGIVDPTTGIVLFTEENKADTQKIEDFFTSKHIPYEVIRSGFARYTFIRVKSSFFLIDNRTPLAEIKMGKRIPCGTYIEADGLAYYFKIPKPNHSGIDVWGKVYYNYEDPFKKEIHFRTYGYDDYLEEYLKEKGIPFTKSKGSEHVIIPIEFLDIEPNNLKEIKNIPIHVTPETAYEEYVKMCKIISIEKYGIVDGLKPATYESWLEQVKDVNIIQLYLHYKKITDVNPGLLEIKQVHKKIDAHLGTKVFEELPFLYFKIPNEVFDPKKFHRISIHSNSFKEEDTEIIFSIASYRLENLEKYCKSLGIPFEIDEEKSTLTILKIFFNITEDLNEIKQIGSRIDAEYMLGSQKGMIWVEEADAIGYLYNNIFQFGHLVPPEERQRTRDYFESKNIPVIENFKDNRLYSLNIKAIYFNITNPDIVDDEDDIDEIKQIGQKIQAYDEDGSRRHIEIRDLGYGSATIEGEDVIITTANPPKVKEFLDSRNIPYETTNDDPWGIFRINIQLFDISHEKLDEIKNLDSTIPAYYFTPSKSRLVLPDFKKEQGIIQKNIVRFEIRVHVIGNDVLTLEDYLMNLKIPYEKTIFFINVPIQFFDIEPNKFLHDYLDEIKNFNPNPTEEDLGFEPDKNFWKFYEVLKSGDYKEAVRLYHYYANVTQGFSGYFVWMWVKKSPYFQRFNAEMIISYGGDDDELNEQAPQRNRNGLVKDFVKYAIQTLTLEKPLPKLRLTKDKSETKTYGHFDPGTNTIVVYIKGRSLADIMRTIAHELVHRKQDQDNRLDASSGETGSPIENEANAEAGVLLRNFGEKHPMIFEIKNVGLKIKATHGDNNLHHIIEIKTDKNEIIQGRYFDNENWWFPSSSIEFFTSKHIPYEICNEKAITVNRSWFDFSHSKPLTEIKNVGKKIRAVRSASSDIISAYFDSFSFPINGLVEDNQVVFNAYINIFKNFPKELTEKNISFNYDENKAEISIPLIYFDIEESLDEIKNIGAASPKKIIELWNKICSKGPEADSAAFNLRYELVLKYEPEKEGYEFITTIPELIQRRTPEEIEEIYMAYLRLDSDTTGSLDEIKNLSPATKQSITELWRKISMKGLKAHDKLTEVIWNIIVQYEPDKEGHEFKIHFFEFLDRRSQEELNEIYIQFLAIDNSTKQDLDEIKNLGSRISAHSMPDGTVNEITVKITDKLEIWGHAAQNIYMFDCSEKETEIRFKEFLDQKKIPFETKLFDNDNYIFYIQSQYFDIEISKNLDEIKNLGAKIKAKWKDSDHIEIEDLGYIGLYNQNTGRVIFNLYYRGELDKISDYLQVRKIPFTENHVAIEVDKIFFDIETNLDEIKNLPEQLPLTHREFIDFLHKILMTFGKRMKSLTKLGWEGDYFQYGTLYVDHMSFGFYLENAGDQDKEKIKALLQYFMDTHGMFGENPGWCDVNIHNIPYELDPKTKRFETNVRCSMNRQFVLPGGHLREIKNVRPSKYLYDIEIHADYIYNYRVHKDALYALLKKYMPGMSDNECDRWYAFTLEDCMEYVPFRYIKNYQYEEIDQMIEDYVSSNIKSWYGWHSDRNMRRGMREETSKLTDALLEPFTEIKQIHGSGKYLPTIDPDKIGSLEDISFFIHDWNNNRRNYKEEFEKLPLELRREIIQTSDSENVNIINELLPIMMTKKYEKSHLEELEFQGGKILPIFKKGEYYLTSVSEENISTTNKSWLKFFGALKITSKKRIIGEILVVTDIYSLTRSFTPTQQFEISVYYYNNQAIVNFSNKTKFDYFTDIKYKTGIYTKNGYISYPIFNKLAIEKGGIEEIKKILEI